MQAWVHPAEIPSAKAYELMSCVEGLAELARLNGDRELAQAVPDGMQTISDDEITVIGSGLLPGT